ncbi:MAG: type III pantothenate kinase [Acidobacteria bacterium]|nr:type III pantothenate kinase [Acidobacteriota bacterium]
MLLAIDIGNTNITLGLFDGDALGPRWRFAAEDGKPPDEYGLLMLSLFRQAGVAASAVAGTAISSVVPALTDIIARACRRYLNDEPLVVTGACRTGLAIRYEDASQLGVDRMVDVVAALRLYGGPACVVDFGTATTFDAVTEGGEYLGGAIAPGIGIIADALFRRAAKLPKVALARPPAAIGRNVTHSLQSGTLFGYVGLVEGLVERFRAELGPGMNVIATGGMAELIAGETPVIPVIAPWLTLDGLRIIYGLNSD